jgi:polyisoprenyl-phosphate glycosyltransferase
VATDIIVPAYNEESRIGAVLEVLTRVPRTRVLVVDDGSKDRTADVARGFRGVDVLSLKPNRGKGGAMRAALEATSAPIVVFVDADLLGLTPRHIESLITPLLERPEYGQIVGMRDWKGWVGELQSHMPIISGERAVRRALLSKMPASLWSGFKVEAGINDTVSRAGYKTGLVDFDGVTIVHKTQKFGVAKGLAKFVDMGKEIVTAMTEARIAATHPNPFAPPSGTAPSGQSLADALTQDPAQSQPKATAVRDASPAASLEAKCDSVECVADAIMGSAVRAAEPIVVEKVIPQVLADHRALSVLGRSVGEGMADRLVGRMWVAFVLVAAIIAAAAFAGSYYGQRANRHGVL